MRNPVILELDQGMGFEAARYLRSYGAPYVVAGGKSSVPLNSEDMQLTSTETVLK